MIATESLHLMFIQTFLSHKIYCSKILGYFIHIKAKSYLNLIQNRASKNISGAHSCFSFVQESNVDIPLITITSETTHKPSVTKSISFYFAVLRLLQSSTRDGEIYLLLPVLLLPTDFL